MGLQLSSLRPHCFCLQSCPCKMLPLGAGKLSLWGDSGKNPAHTWLLGCSGAAGSQRRWSVRVQRFRRCSEHQGRWKGKEARKEAGGLGKPLQECPGSWGRRAVRGVCCGRCPLSCSFPEEQQPDTQTCRLSAPAAAPSGSHGARPGPTAPLLWLVLLGSGHGPRDKFWAAGEAVREAWSVARIHAPVPGGKREAKHQVDFLVRYATPYTSDTRGYVR